MSPISIRNWIIGSFIGCAGSFILAWPAYNIFSPLQIVTALAILWIGIAPAIFHGLDRNRGRFAFFPVSCLFYAICFGLPLFLAPLIWPTEGHLYFYAARFDDLTEIAPLPVLLIAAAGLLTYVLGFYASRYFFHTLPVRFRLPEVYNQHRLLLLLWALLIASIGYRYIPALKTIPSIGQFLLPAGYVALAGFFVLWRAGQLTKPQVLLVLLTLGCWAANIVFGALLTPIMMIGLLLFLLMLDTNRKATILMVVASLVFLFSFSMTSHYYRGALNHMAIAGNDNPTVHDRLSAIASSLGRAKENPLFSEESTGNFGIVSSILKRVSFLPLMTVVDRASPEDVPYWQGETYRPLITSFIPRALWPNKPEERAGRAFALRYKLDFEGSDTSINIPWIVELMANFGRSGIIVGMGLIGLFMAFVDRFFNRRDATPLEGAIGLGIIFPLVYQESNFSVICGSLLPLTICLYLYFRIGLRSGRYSPT